MSTTETTERTISREDYLKALGLGVLIQEHTAALTVLERTLAGLVGEKPDSPGSTYYGHVTDAVYSDRPGIDIDTMLRQLNISVEEA